MKLIFAGTPDFAAQALESLLQSRHRVVLVLTQPDKPAGRGLSEQASPVKRLAESRGLPVHQPASLKDPAAHRPLIDAGADALIVAAYGLILPQAVLDIPTRGAINIHASLLPRWRGAAPIQRAVLAGDPETGISIMQMDAGLDTGPVLLKRAVPIGARDTAGTVHDALAALGGKLVVEALEGIEAGTLIAQPQDDRLATYAAKVRRREALIDWENAAERLDRHVRAFNPVPGAFTSLRNVELKIWGAAPVALTGMTPGTVLSVDDTGICVACGTGALRLSELQRPGGKRLGASDFLRGFPVHAGERFGA